MFGSDNDVHIYIYSTHPTHYSHEELSFLQPPRREHASVSYILLPFFPVENNTSLATDNVLYDVYIYQSMAKNSTSIDKVHLTKNLIIFLLSHTVLIIANWIWFHFHRGKEILKGIISQVI